jgi:hypothetical protein
MLYDLLLGDYVCLYEGLYRVYKEDLPYFGTALLRLNCTYVKNVLISEVQRSGSKGREMI